MVFTHEAADKAKEMPWPKGMLPEKYERMFKDEGMFAYYFHVDEVPGARKQVQHWWRNG